MTVIVGAVGLQYQGYLQDEVGLDDVPVVVRHTIGNDIVCPLLEGSII